MGWSGLEWGGVGWSGVEWGGLGWAKVDCGPTNHRPTHATTSQLLTHLGNNSQEDEVVPTALKVQLVKIVTDHHLGSG